MTNTEFGVFYTGVTCNLPKRIWEHREGVFDGFSKKYNTKLSVYYEIYEDAERAITREKRLKCWPREWKINAIN